MKTIKRIISLFFLTLFMFLAVTHGWAQSKTSGQVSGINPDHGYVLRLVSNILQDRHIGLWSVETASNDLLSNFEEFRAHLLPYRARFRFHVDENSLIVTMEALESPGKGTWSRSLIPADGAQAKLIAQVVDQLNAANQKYMGERRAQGLERSSSSSTTGGATDSTSRSPRKAKSLVFDPVPVRCAEGMCPVQRDGLWGFIDYDGNLVLDFKYHSPTAPSFSRGACVVQATDSDNHVVPGAVYIDKAGNLLFGGRKLHSARPFVGERATVVLFEPENNQTVVAALDLQGHIQRMSRVSSDTDFHEGLIVAQGGPAAKYGFKSEKAQWVIQPVYDQVQPFSDGAAWVAQTTVGGVQKWGAIDERGKAIIPFAFSVRPEPFSDGLAVVSCTDHALGYVDKAGRLEIPCQFASASHFDKGVAWVQHGGKSLLINSQGISISDGVNPQLLDELLSRDDGLYNFSHTEIQRLTGLLDEKWNVILPAAYQFIGPFPDDADPKGLAWASSASANFHQGFVNRRGEFILTAEKSMF